MSPPSPTLPHVPNVPSVPPHVPIPPGRWTRGSRCTSPPFASAPGGSRASGPPPPSAETVGPRRLGGTQTSGVGDPGVRGGTQASVEGHPGTREGTHQSWGAVHAHQVLVDAVAIVPFGLDAVVEVVVLLRRVAAGGTAPVPRCTPNPPRYTQIPLGVPLMPPHTPATTVTPPNILIIHTNQHTPTPGTPLILPSTLIIYTNAPQYPWCSFNTP